LRKELAMPALLVGSLLSGLLVSSFTLNGVTPDQVSTLVDILLMAFVFIVSVDVGAGLDRRKVSSLGRDALLLSAGTVTGSLLAGLAFSFIPSLGLKGALAASLGMGWYTLDGPLVTASLGVLAGATGFFSNFLRELFTFFAYPIFRRMLGGRSSISLGGATTMDTTLTVISAVGGNEVGALSFLHGVIITLLVPFLVTLALTILP
jgi:uncharacterized membrane protein YbjE (DUF340 family)